MGVWKMCFDVVYSFRIFLRLTFSFCYSLKDLTLEAKHLTRFNRDFAGDPTVSFPKALNELTTTRVLTETFIHGTPILHFVNAPEEDRKQVALLGLTTTLKMIFLNDFLHGK